MDDHLLYPHAKLTILHGTDGTPPLYCSVGLLTGLQTSHVSTCFYPKRASASPCLGGAVILLTGMLHIATQPNQGTLGLPIGNVWARSIPPGLT